LMCPTFGFKYVRTFPTMDPPFSMEQLYQLTPDV
jgi:hypothetical protein